MCGNMDGLTNLYDPLIYQHKGSYRSDWLGLRKETENLILCWVSAKSSEKHIMFLSLLEFKVGSEGWDS